MMLLVVAAAAGAHAGGQTTRALLRELRQQAPAAPTPGQGRTGLWADYFGEEAAFPQTAMPSAFPANGNMMGGGAWNGGAGGFNGNNPYLAAPQQPAPGSFPGASSAGQPAANRGGQKAAGTGAPPQGTGAAMGYPAPSAGTTGGGPAATTNPNQSQLTSASQMAALQNQMLQQQQYMFQRQQQMVQQQQQQMLAAQQQAFAARGGPGAGGPAPVAAAPTMPATGRGVTPTSQPATPPQPTYRNAVQQPQQLQPLQRTAAGNLQQPTTQYPAAPGALAPYAARPSTFGRPAVDPTRYAPAPSTTTEVPAADPTASSVQPRMLATASRPRDPAAVLTQMLAGGLPDMWARPAAGSDDDATTSG
jgi:hypothetical protein